MLLAPCFDLEINGNAELSIYHGDARERTGNNIE